MVAANTTVDIPSLKARHPLGDTVEAAGVALRGKGRVRQGVCPFHQEAEGSFTVYSDSERFYCFGCGSGGDVLDFVQRMEGLTLPEAIRRLDDGSGAGCGASPAASFNPTARRSRASVPGPGAADGGGKVLRRATAAQPGCPAIPDLAGHRPGRRPAPELGLRAGPRAAGISAIGGHRQRAAPGLRPVPGTGRGAVRRNGDRSRHRFGPGPVADRTGG